ncbi:MAG: hypothetical protein OXF60_07300 [Gammaproteobacteria bacterium]|nr:hypothetical protein [Gammaproteobacteria bacterium]
MNFPDAGQASSTCGQRLHDLFKYSIRSPFAVTLFMANKQALPRGRSPLGKTVGCNEI